MVARRIRRILLALALMGALSVPIGAPAQTLPPAGGPWPEAPALVPGTATVADGVFTYTDYPYDDNGTGSFAYPTAGAYAGNAADPVVVQIRRTAAGVEHLVSLNTLVEADTTIVGFAIDTDGDPATGGGLWPANAKATSAGWDLFVATWGSGAAVTTAAGETTALPATVDVTANTIGVTIPSTVADPGESMWRYWGGAGVHDGNGGFAEVVGASRLAPATSPTGKPNPAEPNVFNLLFRNRTHDGGTTATDESRSGGFQFARQSAALSANDIAPFNRAVDFASLTTGAAHMPAEPPGDIDITRVYASAAFPNLLAEGVTSSGTSGKLYNGRFQPYRLFVPVEYRADPSPAPMIPMLHGWRGSHRGFNPSSGAFWTKVVRPNRAIVPKPLGRGQEIWYEHLGELDVLEVMDDVARHHNIDPDRVYLGGTSMGGFGSVKIAEAHPDRFAGILPSVPPMSDRATGYAHPAANEYDLVEHLESLRNTPVRNFTGTYDALVPVGNDSRRMCDRLKTLVYDHDCWRDVHPSTGRHRGFENDRADQIAQLLAEHTRVTDPARITYEINPWWVSLNAGAGISHLLPYDKVWWASGIRYDPEVLDVGGRYLDCRAAPEAHTCFGELDVRTWGRGEGDPIAFPFAEQPSATLLRDGIVLRPGPAVAARNAFDLTVANLTGVTLDLARMGLKANPAKPLSATVVNNGRDVGFELVLANEVSAKCTALLDGTPVPSAKRGDELVLTLSLTTGTHDLRVVC